MTNLSWLDLTWCVIPVLMVGIIYWRWAGDIKELSVACIRMLIQLIGVGYVLIVIFNRPSWWASTLILSIMFIAAAWIAIRPVKQHQSILWPTAIALFLSVGTHLFLSLVLVLDIEQWFAPRVLIPLGGMYLANTMTTISLTVERYFSELSYGNNKHLAKQLAFKAAMIPQINGLLAVGLVALPGMMTGQILSGISPLIAVRYQIMIMTMLLGCCGLGSAIILWHLSKQSKQNQL